MSANLVVDLNGSCTMQYSVPTPAQLSPSGQICGLSGVQTGLTVDLVNANTFCNVVMAGTAVLASGPLVVQVQCSEDGSTWFDPTSGLSQLPTVFFSGGNIVVNSGSTGGCYNGQASGYSVQSGFVLAAGFQRNGRYARLLVNSGFYIGTLQAGFISQSRTTGSGAGYSFQPGSGSVSV